MELDAASPSAGTALMGWMAKPTPEPAPDVAFLLWYWCNGFGREWGRVREVADRHPGHLGHVQEVLREVLEGMDVRRLDPAEAQRRLHARIAAMGRRDLKPGAPCAVGAGLREWGVARPQAPIYEGLLDLPFTAAWAWEDGWDTLVLFYETEAAFGYVDWWLSV